MPVQWKFKKSQDTRKKAREHAAFLGRIQARGVSKAILAGTAGCLWCDADPRDSHAAWCGRPRMPGRPYCHDHVLAAYVWTE